MPTGRRGRDLEASDSQSAVVDVAQRQSFDIDDTANRRANSLKSSPHPAQISQTLFAGGCDEANIAGPIVCFRKAGRGSKQTCDTDAVIPKTRPVNQIAVTMSGQGRVKIKDSIRMGTECDARSGSAWQYTVHILNIVDEDVGQADLFKLLRDIPRPVCLSKRGGGNCLNGERLVQRPVSKLTDGVGR